MWIDRDGNIYGGGQCKPGDRMATPEEIARLHGGLRACVQSFDGLPRTNKALLLAAAAMAGKSPAEAETGFNAALEAQ